MQQRIQQVTMPNLAFAAPEEMYVRFGTDLARASYNEQRIQFSEGGKAVFDTFFNGLNLALWKRHCPLNDLYFSLAGTGSLVLRFGLHRIGHADRWLAEIPVDLTEEGRSFELPFWATLQEGMLYVAVQATGPCRLNEAYFSTSTPPRRRVKLGIVITHFNRKQYVLPALERVREQLLADPVYSGKIELIIVDNSQNISAEEARGVTVIPNSNLGGSGGFTRGLLHLKDDSSFTHCLFMDDDASCEVESIRRTYQLLQFATAERFAVAGSLLREVQPYRLFEKGAKFDGIYKGLKAGLDMRAVPDLLRAEQEETRPDYGAWWFFAFKISDVVAYPFPFFVRGDDILFGLMNKFNIATANGIGCWGEDFGLKSGPLPRYFDVRNHVLQRLINAKFSRYSTAALITQFFATAALSYNYASARAARIALADALKGPSFWRENIDATDIRRKVGSQSDLEKMGPVDRFVLSPVHPQARHGFGFTMLRVMTLNGFLLPEFLLKNEVAFQHKGFRATFREIFRYKRVLYEYEPLGLGYVAEHNKRRFFFELFAFLGELARFLIKFQPLRREYRHSLSSMTSEEYWRQVYSKREGHDT